MVSLVEWAKDQGPWCRCRVAVAYSERRSLSLREWRQEVGIVRSSEYSIEKSGIVWCQNWRPGIVRSSEYPIKRSGIGAGVGI
jgi:hypothetical protein